MVNSGAMSQYRIVSLAVTVMLGCLFSLISFEGWRWGQAKLRIKHFVLYWYKIDIIYHYKLFIALTKEEKLRILKLSKEVKTKENKL